MTPEDIERGTNHVLRDVVLINKFNGSGQMKLKQIDPLADLEAFEAGVPKGDSPLRYLAEGSFGLVELGRLRSTHEPVVVKTPTLMDDLDSFEMGVGKLISFNSIVIH